MSDIKFNKCQTPIDELKIKNEDGTYSYLEDLPKEVQEQFFDFLNNVPFIRWLVSPDRPMVSELPRDDEGKALIDVTRPPILENTNFFRPMAKAFQNQSCFTKLKPNANPNSEYGKWLLEERRRAWDGLIDPSTGMWVTGDMYWMLNYCPMHLVKKGKNGMTLRTVDFPAFWDGQFLVTHYIQQARWNGKHGSELASRGKGKAHPYSQIVYTPDGVKQWGDIKVGDTLFGDDGNPTKVTMIPFDAEEKIYTVTLADGRQLKCTSGHLFKVKDHRKHPSERVVSLWEIMHSDYAHKRRDGGIEYYYAVPNNGKVEFKSQSVLVDPYTLGLLLGDGTLTNNSTNSIGFTSRDEDVVTYKEHIPYEIRSRKGNYAYSILINGIKSFLQEWGLDNATSEKKFIPKEYLFNSSDVRMALLQGLMDTDGTVNGNKVPMITTTSKRLARDIRWLCHSLGYNSTMFTKQGKYKDDKGVHICKLNYNITILTNDPIFRLERKLVKLGSFNSAYSRSRKDWTRIVDIKYSHREKAKCVIVDNKSHCYLIDEFIVTHNTSLGGALLSKRFILGETSENQSEVQCLVTAADRTKLIGTNQILNVFIDDIDFCAKHAPFDNKRLQSSVQELSWQAGYKRSGSDVKYGSKNSVMGIISGVNQDKLNGSRGVLYIIEEAGIFKDLLSMINLIRPSVEQGTSVFGQLFLYGTAGDSQSNFQDFQEIIYSPNGYNMQPLPNVYDKEGQGRQQITVFYPAYLNKDDGCMDENGNSDVTKALLELLVDRYKIKYGSTDINTITKRISQYPITPQEAILQTNNTMFPVSDLNERLNQLDNNPSEYDDVYVGELVQRDGKVEFNPTGDIPIRDFPTKDNKLQGALEIFAMPQKDPSGNVFPERYIIGLDPIDNDQANTMSFGSMFVLDLWTDTIAAEYTGRPPFANDLYELVRKTCLFYNAKCLYENNLHGIFSYFSQHNCTYLLADTPEYLKERELIKTIGSGNTSKGVRAGASVIKYALKLIRDWLMKPVSKIEHDAEGNEVVTSIPNLYKLRNRALIKEMILWNPNINVDRCVLEGTQIQTLQGIKQIQDISLEDRVLTLNGKYNNVCQLHKNPYVGQIYSFRALGDYRMLHCTYNHPILTRHKTGASGKYWMKTKYNMSTPSYKDAQDITKDDFVLVPKRTSLPKCNLDDDLLYLIGWYIADGNISSGNYVKFSLQEDQYEIALVIQKLLNKYWKREYTLIPETTRRLKDRTIKVSAHTMAMHVEAKVYKSYNYKGKSVGMWNVEIASKEAKDFFAKYGGIPNNKDINDSLYNTMGLLPLIRGFFEGDGHYRCETRCDGIMRNSLEVNSIYEQLMHKIRQILLDEGIWCTIRKVKPRGLMKHTQYNINITNENVIPIIQGSLKFKQDVPTCKHTNKTHYVQDDYGFWVKVRDLHSYAYNGHVYNIGVEKDHTYCANGIITHNCMALAQVMLYREEKMILYQGDLQGGKNKTFSSGLEDDPFFTNNYRFSNDMKTPAWVNRTYRMN